MKTHHAMVLTLVMTSLSVSPLSYANGVIKAFSATSKARAASSLAQKGYKLSLSASKGVRRTGSLVNNAARNAYYSGRYNGIVRQLDNFMGNGASIKKADEARFVAVGKNGNRFRMDYTGHGDKPHFHLETPRPNGRYKPATGTNHREYFKE